RAGLSARPFAVARYTSGPMQALLARTLAAAPFDAVICDTPYGAANLPALHCPLLLHAHNLEHDLVRQYARVARNPAVRVYAHLEAAHLRRWERALARRAQAILSCSAADRRRFAALAPETPAVVAPNVLCLSDYAAGPAGDDRTLVYQGGMDWLPNRDAVAYFAARILPLVRQRVPQARLVAAGRTPPPKFARHWRRAAGVEFTGTLPDLRPIIRQSALSIVPLRLGGGTRLKILEAAALGRAIVSTRLGAEGLAFTPGAEIEIADGATAFAQAVISLLLDRQRRAAMGAAARRRIEQSYGLPQLCVSLRRALRLVQPQRAAEPLTLGLGA
ncbi:MAG: glycosyltransferase family 4 protein, partial [Terriglobales bacterium]